MIGSKISADANPNCKSNSKNLQDPTRRHSRNSDLNSRQRPAASMSADLSSCAYFNRRFYLDKIKDAKFAFALVDNKHKIQRCIVSINDTGIFAS